MPPKHLLSVLDVKEELFDILALAKKLKIKHAQHVPHELTKGKVLGLLFEKPSTRTRVSFEVAMTHLGGTALYLSSKDLQLGRGETIGDTAKVLSRYVDGLVYRALDHKMVVELARNATIPVINGLDNLEHPCQALADIFTIHEKKNKFASLKLAYIGDGNNVCNSLLLGCAIVGMNITAACPNGYEPNSEIFKAAESIAKSNIELTNQPECAAKGADVIYTDVWISMGMEEEQKEREKIFLRYQVNSKLVKLAKKNCIIMHCLPAHRGMEITDDVIDSNKSVVFDQAENRLHVQKAILAMML